MVPEKEKNRIYRQIPSVDYLLETQPIKKTMATTPKALVLKAIRQVLKDLRAEMESAFEKGCVPDLDIENIINRIEKRVSVISKPSLRSVINATGVVVHTNLGRSVLSEAVIDRLKSVAGHYCNLEYDLELGKRGDRYVHVEEILKELTGAEAAMVVNNNAAAVLVCLDTLAGGREVVISRGQLVEIGGSFRMPEVMKKSGCKMVEVGTTNKTTLKDYEEAIGPETSLLLKVHPSNFRVLGFTGHPGLGELVSLAKTYEIPVMEDLGSGCFIDFSVFGLEKEPTVKDSLKEGVDVITFSGDKMLGGPQCGIILGKKDVVSAIKSNQLNRALRVDKLTLISLQETLAMYRDEKRALSEIPTIRMLSQSYRSICLKLKRLQEMIGRLISDNFSLEIKDSFSRVGGGAMPLEGIRTRLLCLSPLKMPAPYITKYFRLYDPPIVARMEKDQVLIDVRTIQEEELIIVAEAIRELSSGHENFL